MIICSSRLLFDLVGGHGIMALFLYLTTRVGLYSPLFFNSLSEKFLVLLEEAIGWFLFKPLSFGFYCWC